jgi:hypothetical protein
MPTDPPIPEERRPTWLLILVAVVTGAVLFWQAGALLNDPKVLPPDDVVEYWAAGRLNAEGKNPYDPDLLLPLEQTTGRPDLQPENLPPGELPRAVMMWNPPWTLTVAMPLGLLPARIGQLMWLALHFATILWCADKTWRLYGGPVDKRALAWALAISFLPTFLVLKAGQITPLLLLGSVGFLHFERRRQDFLAGVASALLGIKPHLAYLFWVALLIWSLRQRRWGAIVGGVVTGTIATAIPLLCNPQVITQYREAFTNPPDWMSATVGSYLRVGIFLGFGVDRYWHQFVPNGLGLLWLAYYLYRRPTGDWSEAMPLVLLVSFATAAYGAWPFDLVLLLLPIVQGATWAWSAGEKSALRRAALAWYMVIDGGMLAMNLAQVSSHVFVWVAPALLLAHWHLSTLRHVESVGKHS